jgi:hypothetical protein
MMKKLINKYNYLLILLVVGFASCDDQLEIDPIGALSDTNTFQSVGNLQQGLNTAYGRFFPENNIIFDIITDEVKIGADNGGQRINFYQFDLSNQSGEAAGHWNSNYSVINQVNRVLAGAEGVTPESGEQAAYDNIKGQLYGLRALSHFQLFQWFSTDYEDGASLSVPYVDFVVTIEQLPRNTVAEVIAGINSDLAMAESLLSDTNENILLTKDALTAIQARLGLYTDDRVLALNSANELIGKYPLANQVQYVDMFNDADDTEVIFKAKRVVGSDFSIGGIWYFTGSAGPFLEMSNGLYDALSPTDIRRQVNFWESESDPANNSHLIGKYLGPGFTNDMKVFRSSEMYFIKAEVEAKNGLLGDAATTLKQIRDARFGINSALDVYANTNEALTAILAERRIELAYEGHRYLDIKRLRNVLNIGLTRETIDCPDGACTLPQGDFRWNLPIPLPELNANDAMVQNPGYGS